MTLCLATAAMSLAEGATRIAPLGDSITQGGFGLPSYRQALNSSLQSGSYDYVFVGSLSQVAGNPPNPSYSLPHEGHFGWRADELINGSTDPATGSGSGNLSSWLSGYTPDIVLLHIGTNDAILNESSPDPNIGSNTWSEINSIIQTLKNANPSVRIFLAKLIPVNPSLTGIQAGVDAINAQIAANGPGTGATVVDFTGLNANTMLADSFHPNSSGQSYMANIWFNAIKSFVATASPPVITSSSSASGSVGNSFSYTITANNNPTSFGASGLPPGLSLNTSSGAITGTPTAAGNYSVSISATNSFGTDNGTVNMSISKGTASVSLSGLSQTYDGNPKAATVSISPSLPPSSISVTYDGGASAPTNAGNYSVVVSVSDPNYTGGASGTLSVSKAGASVSLSGLSATYDGTSKSVTVSTNPSGLNATITYDGSGSPPSNAGTYAVVASINEPNYAGSGGANLTIARAEQTISFDSLPNQTFGGPAVSLNASASSGLPVSFSVVSGPATVSGSTLTLTGGGQVVVRAAQSGNVNYMAAPHVDHTFSVAKASASVALSNLSQIYDGSPKQVSVSTNPSGLSVSVTYDGGSSAPSQVGSYEVVATITDPDYAGSVSDTLAITKSTQSITFDPPATKSFGDPAFDLTANATSGLPVAFAIVSGPASISGSTLTLSGAGTVTVRASQSGNSQYEPANDVDRDIEVSKGSAAIELSNLYHQYDGSPKSVSAATTPEGLTVSVTYDGEATPPKNAGTYTVAVAIDDENYSGTSEAELVIAKAPLTARADDKERAEGETNPEFTISYTGFAPGEDAGVIDSAPTATTTATAGSPVGMYPISLTGGTDDNYQLTLVNGTLYVGEVDRAPTITDEPDDQSVESGADVVFSLAATGNPAEFTYRWERKASGTTTWIALGDNGAYSGSTTASLMVNAVTVSMSGDEFRCVVGNTVEPDAISHPAALTVSPGDYQGFYFGGFSPGQGRWGLVVRPDGSAIVVGYMGDESSVLVSDGTVDADGVISGSARIQQAQTPIGVTTVDTAITARIIGDTVSGEFVGSGISISGSRDAADSLFDNLRGVYTSVALYANSGTTTLIIGSSGEVVFVALTSDWLEAGSGAAEENGEVSVSSMLGSQVSVHVSPATKELTLAIQRVNTTTQTQFSGLLEGTTSTNHLINLSTRGYVGSGETVLIAGFVVSGSDTRRILVRGIGPALEPLGVSGVLEDPELVLRQGSNVIASNDNWGEVADVPALQDATASTGAFALPDGSKDAAVLLSVSPGPYTATVSGVGGIAGNALVEVYDVDHPEASDVRLVNLSTRALVRAGDSILIPGFVNEGVGPRRLLIRAVGPTLTEFGVAGVLADPVLRLYDGEGVQLAINDDWGTSGGSEEVAQVTEEVHAFSLDPGSLDAAFLVTVPPGHAYTVQISGKAGSSGVALAEVYEVP